MISDDACKTEDLVPESLKLLDLVGDRDGYDPYAGDAYENGAPWAYATRDNTLRKYFFITQYEEHLPTGRSLISEESIVAALKHMNGIEQAFYIRHDKDTYSEEDLVKLKERADDSGRDYSKLKPGDLKPPHFHIVIAKTSRTRLWTIAKAFNVPPERVTLLTGQKDFYSRCIYLTHESEKQQSLGKHRYPDEEVRCYPEEDFRQFVTDLKKKVSSFNRPKDPRGQMDAYSLKVLNGEMKPIDVKRENPALYVKRGFADHLDKMRNRYLSSAKSPDKIINILITGQGGAGKDSLANAICHALFQDEDEPYFRVGDQGTGFNKYAGQPALIWEDFRASTFVTLFGSRGRIFSFFNPYRDIYDSSMVVNIKYGTIALLNWVNIVTIPDNSENFLRNLAGTYEQRLSNGMVFDHKAEDDNQAFRRFPIIIDAFKGSYKLRVNQGFAQGTREYKSYEEIGTFSSPLEEFLRDADHLKLNDPDDYERVLRAVEKTVVSPIIEQIARLRNIENLGVSADELVDTYTSRIEQDNRDYRYSEIIETVNAENDRVERELAAFAASIEAEEEHEKKLLYDNIVREQEEFCETAEKQYNDWLDAMNFHCDWDKCLISLLTEESNTYLGIYPTSDDDFDSVDSDANPWAQYVEPGISF